MKLIYLKSALKCYSLDVAINIKIPFFRILVNIEPGRSLLQFVTTNCLILVILKWVALISAFSGENPTIFIHSKSKFYAHTNKMIPSPKPLRPKKSCAEESLLDIRQMWRSSLFSYFTFILLWWKNKTN